MHGGLDAVVEEIDQAEEETAALSRNGSIDDIHRWGSRRCRREGGPFTQEGWPTLMARFFDHHSAFLSEGGARAVVVEEFPETPHQTRDNADFPRPLRESEAGLRLAFPPPARRNGAPHERDPSGRL